MILIWQRWGIAVVLFVLLALGLGYLFKDLSGLPDTRGVALGLFVGLGLVISATLLWWVVRLTVGKVIDKPTPVVVWQQLAEPVVDANGVKRTHGAVPVTHPVTGQQLISNPRSTLFFIPVRFWPYILGGIGILLFVLNFVLLQTQPL
jgi:hypothetical protein